MSATRDGLGQEQLARELDRLREGVLGAKSREFPTIALEDLENAYGDIVIAALQERFTSAEQLAGWLHAALRRDALDIIKSSRFRTSARLGHDEQLQAGSPPAHANVLAREARELLGEFLAELTVEDRKIGYLSLDPDYDWKPREIAGALGLPAAQVRKTLDRVGFRMRQFAAMAVVPGALCAHRRADALTWQKTGEVTLALKLHLRRCPSCRLEQHAAQQTIRAAILPLIPAGSLPLTGGGLLSRLYHQLGAHPAVQRSDEALSRVRKIAPVGGGGGAALAAKLAVGTALIAAGGALHVVTQTSAPARHHRPVHFRAAKDAITVPDTIQQPVTPVVAVRNPTPQQLPAPTTTTTTTATPPPAPDQSASSAAPAPASISTGTARAARDSASSSPAAPDSSSASTPSSKSSGPAAPGGPPAP